MRSLTRWLRAQSGTLRRGGSRRRRFAAAGVIAATAAFAILMITNAFAVHDEKFELDGNVTTEGKTQFNTGTVDWESFFNAEGEKLALPSGFTASGFTKDFRNSGSKFVTSDPTTYTTGSKDTLPISTGWECTSAANVNSKVDIMNAYAAAYTNSSGEQFLYFGMERNANTGNGNVGIWFLQNKVNCETQKEKETLAFKGDHATGDLLIVSEFTNGGGVSTINVYEWEGGAKGKLNPKPVAKGVDCTSKETGTKDTVCATTNGSPEGTNGPITTPWLTANKEEGVGHKLQTSEFFEGGLNLTKAKLGNKCFNVFIDDTRSSQSLTATLFDFARGELGECESETKTTPVESDGTTEIPSEGLTIPASGTLEVKDKANVTVKGVSSFEGTVTFHLCGPLSASSTTVCKEGGVPIGEAQKVTSNSTLTSAAATITSAGRYCWRADFSGDEGKGVPSSSDASATECFLIKPRATTLGTEAGEEVKLSEAVTDKASLSGTANEPGTKGPEGSTDGSINPTVPGKKAQGTITFKLYGPDKAGSTTNCNKLAEGFESAHPEGIKVSVNGDGSYGPVSFTPKAPGVYHWKAEYSGDLPNTEGTSHNSECTDAGENVTVKQEKTTTTTRQFVYPQDKTKIESENKGATLSGEVTFKLYDTKAHCEANGETGLQFKEGPVSVSGAAPQFVATKNGSFLVSAETTTTLYWNVQYKSKSESQLDSSSECTESTSVTFVGNDGAIEVP